MTRAHYSRPLQSDAGALIKSAMIRVLTEDGTETLTKTIYVDGISEETRTNPWQIENGIIDFYLDEPTRVSLGVTVPGLNEVVYRDLDVVSTDADIVAIGRQNPAAQSTLKATGPGEWTVIPLTPFGEGLLAAPGPSQARQAMETYSKSEVNVLAVPEPEAGYAYRDDAPFTSPSPAATQGGVAVFGHASGVIAPIQTTVTGIGRPAKVSIFLPGIVHPLVGGDPVTLYAYITWLRSNGTGTALQVAGYRAVPPSAPGPAVDMWTKTGVLAEGTSYTFAAGLYCSLGGTATVVCGSGSKAEILVTHL